MSDHQPFAAALVDTPRGPLQTYYQTVEDRLTWVKGCACTDTLRRALQVEGLQKTVRAAVERRIRGLAGRQGVAS